MIRSFTDSLEDPERPLLAPNYWLLDKCRLILPKDRNGRALCIFLPQVVALFVVTQYVDLYFTKSDVDQVLINLRISMLSTVCVVKAYTLLIWQKDWTQLFQYVTVADKYERDTRDKVRGKILDKYTKYCRRVTYLYWFLLFMTFFTTVSTPLLIYLSSKTFREELRNGTTKFLHVFSSWMPFDQYSSPGCWITVVWHVVLCAWGGAIPAAYDTNIMVMLVFFGEKMELMRERCKHMLGTEGRGVSDHEALRVIREIHGMHVAHLKHMKILNSVLSPVMFIYMVMCSMMLCATTYQLTSARNAIQTLFVVQYLGFGIAQMFIFFWHSNDVLIKNYRLSSGLYESQWYSASAQQQRNVLLLSGQLSLSHMFTAGPFSNLHMPTFLAILKGAYSYYTLFRK